VSDEQVESICGTVIILFVLWLLFGCTSPEVKALDQRQRDIQECIISGGHPHAGPNETIICQ
jgi:hypothetical protein